MGRGSTQILIRRIVECLTSGPKTIVEIADATGLDRTAIGRYVNILKESRLLIEEQEGTSKKFTIVPTYRTDTYFGLPLDEEAEKQVSSIYYLIKKHWTDKTTKKLLNTHAQKIAFKVIGSCDELKIPSGWYIYGGISVAIYDDSHEYTYSQLSKKVEDCVKEVTEEYAKNEYAWQSKKLQYENASELYKTKEEILKILYGPKFSEDPKRSLHVIIKKVRKLISLAPKAERQEYVKILDAYQDLLLDIYNKLDDAIIKGHKREITTLFEAIWKYIALFNFKYDLRGFYPEKVLDIHFILDIKQQEDEVIEFGTPLQDLIPEEEITNTIEKKLREALDHIKLLGPEEQKKRKQELEKLEKEIGHEKFQEFLLEQVGLN